MEALTKAEVTIEQLHQCIAWARENQQEVIEDLTDCEVFFESLDGMEFSNSVDFFQSVESAIKTIHQLSDFINQNIDPHQCLHNGVPSIATTSKG